MVTIKFTEQEIQWIGRQVERIQYYLSKSPDTNKKNSSQKALVKQLHDRFVTNSETLEKTMKRKHLRALQELCVKCITSLDTGAIPEYTKRMSKAQGQDKAKIQPYLDRAKQTRDYIGQILDKVEGAL